MIMNPSLIHSGQGRRDGGVPGAHGHGKGAIGHRGGGEAKAHSKTRRKIARISAAGKSCMMIVEEKFMIMD